jgi:hypothetical protein
MNKITSILAIVFFSAMCILWPFWLADGYLDNWYLIITTFITAYGGLVGNLIWYIRSKKGWK